MVTEKLQKKYTCKNCDYFTSNRSNWKKHILTPKHKNGNNGNKKVAKKLSMLGNPKKQENELSSFIEGERASIIAAAEKKYYY